MTEALRNSNPYINSEALESNGSEEEDLTDEDSEIDNFIDDEVENINNNEDEEDEVQNSNESQDNLANSNSNTLIKIFKKEQMWMIKYKNKKDFIQEHDTSSVGLSLFTTSAARVKLFDEMKKVYNTPGNILEFFS